MNCPACNSPVIEGDECCDKCQYPLVDLEHSVPRSTLERNVVRDTIRCLSPKAPLVTTPETTVGTAIQLLTGQDVGCVVITREDRIVGIFSERDVLFKLNVSVKQHLSRPVSEFMTKQVETLDLDDRIALALHKMDLGGYRHLPVTDEGKLVGIISIRDIMRYMTETILTLG
jgi:CBS domain-containing protein